MSKKLTQILPYNRWKRKTLPTDFSSLKTNYARCVISKIEVPEK